MKFESKFVKNLLVPGEGRLFCLSYGGNYVDYEEGVMGKEVYGYSQESLSDRGVYVLDMHSECFIWVGKSVKDKDRQLVMQLGY